ncbi:hypothetical protein JAAARDRAFT_211518 [Jaapia argillacea MUCL 33604]|uniref:Dienelactone hydrolase domain-containing protein n=1 Tax=Jaapia argillacea MUCL 33604 TaxID=933084 RepID=A0A067P710_9AGAM|nr:hypothetical protein JAAARDRAFT_211518 [Jaapia argillacea MUCL 33604]
MSFCKHCISGVRHEGTPTGKLETIGGVECYVATPTVSYPTDKVVLFLPDIFGHSLINAQLLADDYAKNGFKTVIPDYLNGDPVPADALSGANPTFDLGEWFKTHGAAETRPPLDKVIAALKAEGVTTFGATGYCLGARYCFDLAFENIVQATASAHPSLIQPEDLKKYAEVSKAPILINSCEVDPQFPKEKQDLADSIFGDGKFAPGYERTYFPGCTHGFAVRGDMSDPNVKAGKEGAFKSTIEHFIKYL